MKLAVLCPSEIAIRRFMPALQKFSDIEFVGVGVNSPEERFENAMPDSESVSEMLKNENEKATAFITQYGGRIFSSYEEIVTSRDIDALYIPLPPALHYRWAKLALENGKHVLVEKPSTISSEHTEKLVEIAKKNGVALHENYMFIFHEQLNRIDELIASGEIGDIRLYRISFGFPMRMANDFRYNKKLGGGALIDAGGYTIKYATRLLGDSAHIVYAQMNNIEGFEVDMYGSAAMVNSNGITAQLAFGMDNNYKCELEAWGSKGCITTGRILTAPVGFIPKAIIRKGNEDTEIELPEDDAFAKSIQKFIDCTHDINIRNNNYNDIMLQARLVDQFREVAN